jgi:predicted phage tail protein
MSGLVEVHLYGPLADQFGEVHYFDVRTPREAVRALAANYPEFAAEFVKFDRYAVLADGDWRDGADGAILPVSREVHLLPRTEGGAFLGAALVGMLIPALAGTFIADLVGGLLITALLWGVSQLFFKPQDPMTEDDKSESYTFSGAENTAVQGSAVPVIYGRCFVGSVIVSAGLEVGEQVITSRTGKTGTIPNEWDVETFGKDPPNPEIPNRDDMPRLIRVNLGTKENPHFRVAPEGWKHMGAINWAEGSKVRTLDLFVSPQSTIQWDYYRGFAPYDEKAFSA